MPIHKVKGEEIIQCEVKINARPETIFPFFIDPVKMLKWKGIKANLDPQPGGTYKVEVTPKHVALGKYVEVTPNSRVGRKEIDGGSKQEGANYRTHVPPHKKHT